MKGQRNDVGRRRSRSLVGFESKALCETIPKSAAPAERLLMLLEQSFRYAFSNVQKEGILKEDFDICSFRQKENECFEKIKTIIQEKNLDKLAVAENVIPSDSFIVENNEEYNGAMKVLRAEYDKWSSLVSLYRENLKKKMDTTYEVDASIWKDKHLLYDYSDVLEDMSSTHEKLSQQIASLSSAKNAIRRSLQLNEKFSKTLRWKCESYFQQKMEDSPRTLLRKMSFARRKIKPYDCVK